MKPDATIEVRFKTSAEGGRQGDVTGSYYACPLYVGGDAFECRISLNGLTLRLGETYQLGVKFMNPSLVVPRLYPGTAVSLWEGKEVAVGVVVAADS